jgi:DNA polymerase-3 subunit delta
MKVAAAKIIQFISSPPEAVRAILLYGPDTGLVRERAEALTGLIVEDPKDPFRIAELPASDLRDDPARLSDEASAIAFTGGRRVVRIRDATDVVAGSIVSFCEAPCGDALVIVESGNLAPRSKLRTAFERSEQAAAIPCYADEGKGLRDVILETLGQSKIRVSPDAMSFLMENLGGDRMVSRSELEKLRLYMGEDAEVTIADAIACVGDSASMALDDIGFATASGKIDRLAHFLDRARREGAAAVSILRGVARHFERLHLVSGAIDSGKSADTAMKLLRPPVFFKQADSFRIQLRCWPTIRLGQAINSLSEAEVLCKTTGMPADTICDQALLRLGATSLALTKRRG